VLIVVDYSESGHDCQNSEWGFTRHIREGKPAARLLTDISEKAR